jgi:predicted transcriptional regulator of viral defense system
MLVEPHSCGGMASVMTVWRRHARDHLNAIVEAVDEIESKIAKVRAGYILTEVVGIEAPQISAWSAFAQRRGSRKLDPDGPYTPVFSERWTISLNISVANST